MAAELKTKINDESVEAFINTVEDEKKRRDCFSIIEIMREVSGFEPKMWGTAIVGFGSYHYKYASGHEGDACLVGFSPRKANITLYLTQIVQDPEFTKGLGKFKTSKGCLYINKIEDIDINILKVLIRKAIDHYSSLYPTS